MPISYIPPGDGGGGGGFDGTHNDLDGRSVFPAHPSSAISGLSDVAYSNLFSDLDGVPSTFDPEAHADTHASGGSDPVTIAQSQVTGLTAVLALKADLVDGKVPTSQLPSLTLADIFPVADQTARLALSADPGDIAIQADDGSTWILTATPASESGNWLEISTGATVVSVNGQTGVVVLGYADVGAAAEDHEHVVADITDFPTELTPEAHASTHESGGDDEVDGVWPNPVHATADDTPPDGAAENDWWVYPDTSTNDQLDERITALEYPSITAVTDDYTLVLTDAGKVIEMTAATTKTITVPPNSSVAFELGTIIEIFGAGAGTVSIAAGSGVTVRNAGDLDGQYATASLRKRGEDEWVLSGELAAEA